MSTICTRFVLVFTILVAREGFSQSEFTELARRVPADANTLVLIDIDKAVASPAGQTGNWKNKIENAYTAGLTILVPVQRRVVLASQLDLEFMMPVWQTEIVELSEPTDTTTIAKRTGGDVDNLDTVAAVRLPQDAYVVHFDDQIYGVMLPANRQAVNRWVSGVADRKGPPFSPYLTEAFGYANDLGTPIIMALDLNHVVSEEQTRSRLKERWEEAGLTGKGDPIAVGKVLASIRGVTLGVTLGDKPFGKIKVDFAEDATPLASIAKPLFLTVLDHRGLTIDEFNDWNYEVKGKQMTLSGNFTSSGMRRIMSIFDRPAAFGGSAHQPRTGTAAPTPEQIGKGTLAYFQQVQELLKDLKEEKKQARTYTTGSIAQWCTNYARKINRLPLLYVDPEMITYGTNVAQTLTQMTNALNTGNVEGAIAARNAAPVTNSYSVNTGFGYRSNWWGGAFPVANTGTYSVVDVRATQAERLNIKGNARSASSLQARQILASIDQGTAEIRAKMVQKYQMEF